MNRENWINAAYFELIKRHGDVEENLNPQEKGNYHTWAEALGEYFDEDATITPEDAVSEDLSYM